MESSTLGENYSSTKGRMCRICMTEKRNLISIYSPCEVNYSGLAVEICTKIMEFAKVQITKDDHLPSNICQKCLSSLHASIEFRTLCEASDRTLRKMLNSEECVPIVRTLCEASDRTLRKMLNSEECVPIEDVPLSERLELTLTEVKKEPEVDVDVIIKEEDVDFEFELAPFLNRTKRTYVRRKPLKVHKCEKCGKVFKEKYRWTRHCRNVHKMILPTQERNACEYCSVSFPKWYELKQHQKEFAHYLKEECSVCGKSYSKAYMSDHMRSHLGDKPFLCNHCGRSFLHQFALRKHTFCCSKPEKTLQCSQCNLRFYEMRRLRQHEKMHTDFRQFICEVCAKGFKIKNKLKEHQLIHTKERPHKCETCSKTFRLIYQLKEHNRIHTGLRPYACDLCPAAFTQGHCLKSHKEKLHKFVK